MTTPEIDQELERLFSATRDATQPDAAARERVRTALTPRLAGSGGGGTAWSHRAGAVAGVTLLVAGAAVLWLTAAPEPPLVASAGVKSAPVREPTPPIAAPISAPLSATSTPTLVPSATSRRGKSAPIISSPAVDPAEELALVRQMQHALRAGNFDRALTLATEHGRRFPRGSLLEEREGVRAIARCRLAAPEARPAILESFTNHFGSSPYAGRAKAACQ